MPPTVINIRDGGRFDIYCGRPGPFGNPFVIARDGTRPEVIDMAIVPNSKL